MGINICYSKVADTKE